MNQITVSLEGMNSVIAGFDAMPGQIDRAVKRTVRKTTAWISGQSRREIANQLGVAQKAVKARIQTKLMTNGKTGLVWFGLNRLDASLAGSPSQGRAGVTVRKYRFPGAFLASIYGAAQRVWIRLRSKHYDPEVYPYKPRKSSGELPAGMRGRFPVVKATIAVDTPAVRSVIAAQARKANARGLEILRQELNYEINVKGAR